VWLLRDWYKHSERSLIGHDRIRHIVVNKVNSPQQVLLSVRVCACMCVCVCLSLGMPYAGCSKM